MLNGLIMSFSWGLVLFFDTSSNVRNLDIRHTAGVDQSQDTKILSITKKITLPGSLLSFYSAIWLKLYTVGLDKSLESGHSG